ncbi:MAG: GGDEF domain-containing protein [Acetobacter sp.]|jgi:diguanylate cyclase (GGDEF)-like protein|nr:GGDEF domain-containing protein [Acetobacter sp.]MCH4062235.1 GGDEF domain-containing protein [Acetobacter sp.]MCH4088918.1 GGDEF domain-containing protein [Acetobacter sp.]MCI1292821.1 GGDEF domain-containing protein [Acetobacter sp.]MCI1319078.1 GGDEF domain-containing protein [Acetobacter sp.]
MKVHAPGHDDVSPQPSALSGDQTSELTASLFASRRRWKSLAELTGDILFETDSSGYFTFFESRFLPKQEQNSLLGQHSSILLHCNDTPGINPFHLNDTSRGLRCWLRFPGHSDYCFRFYGTVLYSPSGVPKGTRGLAIDVTEETLSSNNRAVRGFQTDVIHRITTILRKRSHTSSAISEALEELAAAIGATGGLLLSCPLHEERNETSKVASLAHTLPGSSREDCDRARHELLKLQNTQTLQEAILSRDSVQDMILCSSDVRYAPPVMIALWREPGNVWNRNDSFLVDMCLCVFAAAIETEHLREAIIRSSRCDLLTGLLNRESFLSEIQRRLPRLDHEGLPSTILLIGINNFSEINTRYGLETGDELLRQISDKLRDSIRPTDLAGRLGGDIFALWMDGGDQFVAAERAEDFCKNGITLHPGEPCRISLSVGIASRHRNSTETAETLVERASIALRKVKLAGGERWHTSQDESDT